MSNIIIIPEQLPIMFLFCPNQIVNLYKTSMQYYGLELWNSLPNSVKSSQSMNLNAYINNI